MAQIIRSDVWRLNANANWFDTASVRWGRAGTGYDVRARAIGRSQGRLTDAWHGPRADSYFEHVGPLQSAVDDVGCLATALGQVLGKIASALESAASELGASFGRARAGATSVHRDGWDVYFTVPDDENDPMPNLDAEVSRAQCIVEDAQSSLRSYAEELAGIAADGRALADNWRATATGTPGWDVPRGGITGVHITEHGNTTVVNTSDDADTITVGTDPSTGETIITVNGREFRVPVGQRVVINAGGGDDIITIGPDVTAHIRIVGGAGDDVINTQQHDRNVSVFGGDGHDVIETGGGRDYISGGDGHDYVDGGDGNDIIFGGAGNDVLYGMGGDDVLFGGLGDDYLEGATGDDVLFGGAGNDILSGGRGDDVLIGGADDDVLYAGNGFNRVNGGTGDDTAYVQTGRGASAEAEDVHQFDMDPDLANDAFDTRGDDSFVARVEADLDLMRFSPVGQEMLGALDDERDTDQIRIEATDGGNVASADRVGYNTWNVLAHGTTPWYTNGRPPSTGLFHELGHIHQYFSQGRTYDHWLDGGDWIRDADDQPLIERQNVGLPWDTSQVPEADGEDYNSNLTENAWREEQGLPRRDEY